MTDKELLEQFQLIFDSMATKSDFQSLREETKSYFHSLREEIKASETRIKVYIENSVNDRIRSLFDGYQGALEGQAALKVSTELPARELDDIKTRLTILENKTA